MTSASAMSTTASTASDRLFVSMLLHSVTANAPISLFLHGFGPAVTGNS